VKKIIIFLVLSFILVGALIFKMVLGNSKAELERNQEDLQIFEGDKEKKMEPTSVQNDVLGTQTDGNKTYSAVLKTSEGEITIQLNAKETPITVNNFVSLAKKGFYNNTVFHRVIKGFMIQGGDPNGDGTGGPGYKFDDELFEGEYSRGTIAMANSGPNTNGSQFFIMHQDYPLPKSYVIFGKVIAGIEVVDKIASSPMEANSTGEVSKPIKPVKIESVEILEK